MYISILSVSLFCLNNPAQTHKSTKCEWDSCDKLIRVKRVPKTSEAFNINKTSRGVLATLSLSLSDTLNNYFSPSLLRKPNFSYNSVCESSNKAFKINMTHGI